MEIYFYKENEEYGCFSNFSPHGFEGGFFGMQVSIIFRQMWDLNLRRELGFHYHN